MENNSKGMEEAKKRIEEWKIEAEESFKKGFTSVMPLDLIELGLTSLPPLPDILTDLFCDNNQLTTLPHLPSKLVFLSCRNNQLTSLPDLPDSLTELYCINNKLTSLPSLPSTLKIIYFNEGNNITVTKDIFNVWNKSNKREREQFENFSPENQEIIKKYIRSKKVANIRSHKNTPINFTPSKAYMIVGHGGEGDRTFIVPKDCVIVVKGHDAQVAFADSVTRNNLELSKLPIEVIKDPIKYSDEIIKAVGSVLMFTEGMVCPNFYYELFLIFPEYDHTRNAMSQSGLIDLDKNIFTETNYKMNTYSSDITLPNSLIIDSLVPIFKNSLQPKQEDVQNVLEKLGDTTINDIVDNKELGSLFNTYQTNLINTIGTGVYYNFVCRFVDGISKSIYTPALIGPNNMPYNELISDVLSVSHLKNIKTSNPSLYEELKRVRNTNITEAYDRRKILKKHNDEGIITNDDIIGSFFGMASKKQANANIQTATKKRNNARKNKAEQNRLSRVEHRQWRNEFGAMRMETNWNVQKREKMDKLVEREREKAKAQGPEAVARLEEYILTHAKYGIPLDFHGGTRRKRKTKKNQKRKTKKINSQD